MNRILAALLVLSLLAFGAAQEPVTIGVSIPAATHGWTGGVNWWAERTEADLEARYPNLDIVINTASDPSEQANDLQDMVAIDGIDALVILPFESDPLTAPVAQVKEQGVLITVVDRGLIDPTIQDIYVAGNNPEMGRVSCEYIADRLGGEGNIVVLRGIPTVIDNQRVEGCMEVLDQTNIEVLAMEYANWNRDDGFEVMLFIVQGKVKHTFGENLENEVMNEAGDFIYIKPGIPHEVFNIGDGPLVAFVARSTADEWDKIVNYPSQYRPEENIQE